MKSNRIIEKFPIKNIENIKEKLLFFASVFDKIMYLNSNKYEDKYSSFELGIAMEFESYLRCDSAENAFEKLKRYKNRTNDWIFGHFSYDLKNDIENLNLKKREDNSFAELFFFQPKKIIFIKNKNLEFHYLQKYKNEIQNDFEQIKSTKINLKINQKIEIQSKISKQKYLQNIETIKQKIKKGDVYEVNFCQEFLAKKEICPMTKYLELNKISKAPFSAFYKIDANYLICSSPERYIKKISNKIISQPIKGTAKRGDSPKEDLQIKLDLSQNEKEIAENTMIIDLVRNDLSKFAKKESVRVEENCKVYAFEQVFQLISTISCEVEKKINTVDIIKNTFPMGSMTGAPKLSSMQIIDKLENSKRGIYSGCIGWFSPNDNFDFNVVIRSVLYNDKSKKISFSVGGAITDKSNPELEYRECLLKAKAMKEILSK